MTPAGENPVVYVIGDAIGGGASPAVFDQVNPDAAAIVYLGDCYQVGTREEWTKLDTNYPDWVKPLLRPTPGNHDWGNHATGYDPYFAYLGLPNNAHNYTFTIGVWKFIAFNSMAAGDPDPGSEQLDFVAAELDEPGTTKIVYCHHAPFSSDTLHGDNPSIQPVLALMESKAILHMAGHSHGMEEFTAHNGVTPIVQGAGGRALYTFTARPDSAWIDNSHFGLCRLELHDDGTLVIHWLDRHGNLLRETVLKAQPAPAGR
jgi:Calcineurin-like phosphoesterase